MKVKWNERFGRRILGAYEWNRANGFAVDVDGPTAVELLTAPGDEFGLAADDQLATAVGVDKALALLVEAGVSDLAGLAKLTAAQRKRYGLKAFAPREQAQSMMSNETDGDTAVEPALNGGNDGIRTKTIRTARSSP